MKQLKLYNIPLLDNIYQTKIKGWNDKSTINRGLNNCVHTSLHLRKVIIKEKRLCTVVHNIVFEFCIRSSGRANIDSFLWLSLLSNIISQ